MGFLFVGWFLSFVCRYRITSNLQVVKKLTFAYVVLSANCDNIICGLFKSMLAIPISPLASPLPSTTATMTDGACADTAEDVAGGSWHEERR